MKTGPGLIDVNTIPQFNRKFFSSGEHVTRIGSGELGGKGRGLVFIKDLLSKQFNHAAFASIEITVPFMTVLTTEVFDLFMKRNNLYEFALSNQPDDAIARTFQKADFPAEFIGDLRGLIETLHSPLAIRSSSLLEDAMYQPFAGVYATKMIPNNQLEPDIRFTKLIEAIKFVYASTFFSEARNYLKCIQKAVEKDEKMAVIIQEVVGLRHDDHFYPNLSGVARSYNFYPMHPAKPEQGVVDFALGLGKTIVDGGKVWTYSPALPQANPPFASETDLMKLTQLRFWAVNMGKPPAYDPIKETEYLLDLELSDAEISSLRYVASTYDPSINRLVPGIRVNGPRVMNFSPILIYNEFPVNKLIITLLKLCEQNLGENVEIEFAMTLDPSSASKARFGFLQVRPMVVSNDVIDIPDKIMKSQKVIISSHSVMGNGFVDSIHDIVYVKPDKFDAKFTKQIVDELENINTGLLQQKTNCILIGFGRWGSSDPWLGIPVNWSQISSARVIVEATLPNMNVDPSQGSHFFHNLSSFQVCYFTVPFNHEDFSIKWNWLETQPTVSETEFVKHIRLTQPLSILVDGRTGKGLVQHA